MKKLQQLTYIIKGEKEIDTKEQFEKLILCGNDGKESKYLIKDIFAGTPNYDHNRITGYSLLSAFSKSILLKDESGNTYSISHVKTPIFQWFDHNVKENEYELLFDLLKNISIGDTTGNKSEGDGLAAFPTPETLFLCESYERQKDILLSEGFKEFKNGNFRLLHNNKEFVMVEITDENNFNPIKGYDVLELVDKSCFVKLNNFGGYFES